MVHQRQVGGLNLGTLCSYYSCPRSRDILDAPAPATLVWRMHPCSNLLARLACLLSYTVTESAPGFPRGTACLFKGVGCVLNRLPPLTGGSRGALGRVVHLRLRFRAIAVSWCSGCGLVNSARKLPAISASVYRRQPAIIARSIDWLLATAAAAGSRSPSLFSSRSVPPLACFNDEPCSPLACQVRSRESGKGEGFGARDSGGQPLHNPSSGESVSPPLIRLACVPARVYGACCLCEGRDSNREGFCTPLATRKGGYVGVIHAPARARECGGRVFPARFVCHLCPPQGAP